MAVVVGPPVGVGIATLEVRVWLLFSGVGVGVAGVAMDISTQIESPIPLAGSMSRTAEDTVHDIVSMYH